MPTAYNIAEQLQQEGFTSAKQAADAHLHDKHLQLPEKFCELLEFKDQLAALTAKYCPEVMPYTLAIHRHNYEKICQQVRQHLPEKSRLILKPALLNNGDGIILCEDIDTVKNYFAHHQGYDGPHVLQQYIEPPHLLQGHKYSLRFFVWITDSGQALCYQQGYFNICKTAYCSEDLTPREAHLSNEHLSHGNQPDSIQIPTQQAPHFDVIAKRCFSQIKKVVHAALSQVPMTNQQPTATSCFGFDLMLDQQLRPWLLEVNHGPCFPTDKNHPLQAVLYQDFWQASVSTLIKPIMSQSPLAKHLSFITIT